MLDAFTVEIDHIETDAEGESWCEDMSKVVTITKDTPGAKRWHTRDDDGELYYSGWLIGDQTWEVVWMWASGYAGATDVFDGNWKQVI